MAQTVFDEIRSACAGVAERARSVAIDEQALDAYVDSLLGEQEPPTLDPEHHYTGTPEETAAFVVTLDAINFGSGWWPYIQKEPGLSGYFTMATRLTARYRNPGPLTAEELSELTQSETAAIFGQTTDGLVGELMTHFAQALSELGQLVVAQHDGSFADLVAGADGSAARLLDRLAELSYFQDVADHGGRPVPLYKRAQLTAADLSIALDESELGGFEDLDELTIFADNLVPHVLRVDGVLAYEPDLLRRIDAEEALEPGGPEEVEIRAVGLHAVELLCDRARERGHELTPMQADYVLWNRGRQPRYKAIPRHRARSIYY